jgi:hypothetical protein
MKATCATSEKFGIRTETDIRPDEIIRLAIDGCLCTTSQHHNQFTRQLQLPHFLEMANCLGYGKTGGKLERQVMAGFPIIQSTLALFVVTPRPILTSR